MEKGAFPSDRGDVEQEWRVDQRERRMSEFRKETHGGTETSPAVT